MEYQTKHCSTCGIEKEIYLFRRNRNQCLECYQAHRAEYYIANKDKIKQSKKIYYQHNSNKVKKDSNQYYLFNKDKRKDFVEKNKDLLNERRRAANKIRYKNDSLFKLRKLISGSILQSLLSKNSNKNGSIIKFLPYTIKKLKQHLGAQFEPWMNWNNWGKYNAKTWDKDNPSTWTWQIDHIIPHSTFKYSSMEDKEFKKCWALDNLRPLSAKQNWLDGINRTRHRNEK